MPILSIMRIFIIHFAKIIAKKFCRYIQNAYLCTVLLMEHGAKDTKKARERRILHLKKIKQDLYND